MPLTAQTELEQLQGTLEEREAQLQAAQSAVEFLTSQCKEQELHLADLQAKLDASGKELEVRLRAEQELQQLVSSLTVRLKAEANDKEQALVALRRQVRGRAGGGGAGDGGGCMGQGQGNVEFE